MQPIGDCVAVWRALEYRRSVTNESVEAVEHSRRCLQPTGDQFPFVLSAYRANADVCQVNLHIPDQLLSFENLFVCHKVASVIWYWCSQGISWYFQWPPSVFLADESAGQF